MTEDRDVVEVAKNIRYGQLVEARKECRRCSELGLTNPAEVSGGKYCRGQIGPWTQWNGDLNARILVVGQEWGDVASFMRQQGRDNRSPTNEMLVNLLASIGIEVKDAPNGGENTGVYLTNAALCLKEGGAQADVKQRWFSNCAEAFLRAQIDLVRPRVVVTLGEQAYRGVCHAFNISLVKKFSEAVGLVLPIPVGAGVRFVPVYHCGERTRNINRSRAQQFRDWRIVGTVLEESASS